jgi:hypothetical protein
VNVGFNLAVIELDSVRREDRLRVERCPGHPLAERAVTRKCAQWHLARAKADLAAKAAARE